MRPAAAPGPLGRLTRTGQVASYIDQAQFNGTKFFISILFARLLSVEGFGIYSVVLAIAYLALQLQRSSQVLPFIVSCRTAREIEAEGARWFGLSLTLSLAVALLAGGAASIAGLTAGGFYLDRILAAVTYTTPPLLIYEFSRRFLYQRHRHGPILLMSGTFMVAHFAGLWLVWRIGPTPERALLAFGAASALGAVVGLAANWRYIAKPSLAHLAMLKAKTQFTIWQTLTFLMGSVFGQAMVLILGAMGGPVSSAIFNAARTIASPTNSIVGAVDSIDKPLASRAYATHGLPGLRRAMLRSGQLILATGTPFLALLILFADPIMGAVYGIKYQQYGEVLQGAAFFYFLRLVSQPLESQLIILEQSRAMFAGTAVSAAATVALAFGLIPAFGALGAVAAMIIGRLASIGLYGLAVLRAYAKAA